MTGKITCAYDLVAGLGEEGASQKIQIAYFQEEQTSFDALFATSFVSCRCLFTRAFREKFGDKILKPFFYERGVKFVKDSIDVVSHTALIAQWNNYGLPNYRVSIENALAQAHSSLAIVH